MVATATQEITKLLKAWSGGDLAALDELTPLCYPELRRLAHRHMRHERMGHSIQTSALVNEAFLRLTDWEDVEWQNRAQFFAIAARIMRNVLVDFARMRRQPKRGGDLQRVSMESLAGIPQNRSADILALDDALGTLATLSERQSRVVELRFFGGLTIEEIADVLQISTGTVRRDWSLARAWLYRELSHERTI